MKNTNIARMIGVLAAAFLLTSCGENPKDEEAAEPSNQAVAAAPVEAIPVLEFPFKAVIKCHYASNNIPLYACLSSDGLQTELELTNGQDYGMYKNIDIIQGRVGRMTRDQSLEIELRENFSLTIQNARETYMVNVQIFNQATNEKVFEKSAAQFGVVAVSN